MARKKIIPEWFALHKFEYLRDCGPEEWATIVGLLGSIRRIAETGPAAIGYLKASRPAFQEMDDDAFVNAFFSSLADNKIPSITDGSFYRGFDRELNFNRDNFQFGSVESIRNGRVAVMASAFSSTPEGAMLLERVTENSRCLSRAIEEAEDVVGVGTPFFVPNLEGDDDLRKFSNSPFNSDLLGHRNVWPDMNFPARHVAVVNLGLPDSVILRHFDAWLSAMRKVYPHQPAENLFTAWDIKEWVRLRYVPLALLLYWSKLQSVWLTNPLLLRTLYDADADVSEDKLRKTIRPNVDAWISPGTVAALHAQADLDERYRNPVE